MKTILSLLTGLLLLPFTVAAELPAPSEVMLKNTANGVEVSWTAVEGASAYTLYWSGAEDSIIASNGYFEDYLRTETSATSKVLPADFLEGYSTLHVAVLTLDSEGDETTNFTAEATINVTKNDENTNVVAPVAMPPLERVAPELAEEPKGFVGPQLPPKPEVKIPEPAVQNLQLNEVLVINNTTLNALFSENIDASSIASSIVSIKSKDVPLDIVTMSANGNVLTITTEPQTEGVVYRLEMQPGLVSVNGAGLSDATTILFQGSDEVSAEVPEPAASSSSSSQAPPAPPEPVVPEVIYDDIEVKTELIVKNPLLADLVVRWVKDREDITAVIVSHSRDNGVHFKSSEELSPDLPGVRLEGLTPGEVTIRVEMLTESGEVVASSAFKQVVEIPEEMRANLHSVAATLPLTASVTSQARPPKNSNLNSSGPGQLAWLLILSGAVAGMVSVRRFMRTS